MLVLLPATGEWPGGRRAPVSFSRTHRFSSAVLGALGKLTEGRDRSLQTNRNRKERRAKSHQRWASLFESRPVQFQAVARARVRPGPICGLYRASARRRTQPPPTCEGAAATPPLVMDVVDCRSCFEGPLRYVLKCDLNFFPRVKRTRKHLKVEPKQMVEKT